MNDYLMLPKALLEQAFNLLGQMPAAQSRSVMNAIEAQARPVPQTEEAATIEGDDAA